MSDEIKNTDESLKQDEYDKLIPDEAKTSANMRPLAPADYKFNEKKATLQIIISGNKSVSSVRQMDEKYYRVLWQRGATKNGDMSELQEAIDWRLTSGLDTKTDSTTGFVNSRIPIFFATLGALIDGRAFPQRSTVDSFVKSAISFLYEKEEFWKWVHRWFYIAQPGREPLKRDLIKVSQKFEKNKVYVYRLGEQLSLFSEKIQDDIMAANVEIVGADFSVIENDCVHAIQTLLSDNDYQPTWTGENGEIGFSFTPTAFLDACGVQCKINKYGKKEYDINGRRTYLKALESLSRKTFLIVHHTKPDHNGGRWKMSSVSMLFRLHTLKRVTKSGKEQIHKFAISDYEKTLMLDIVNYFLLMPRGINKKIRELTGRTHTRGHDRFIRRLFTTANEKRRSEKSGKPTDWTIEYNHSTIFKFNEFANMARERHFDLILERWKSYCELGKSMGYINTVQTVDGKREKKDIIELNRNEFCKLWQDLDPNKYKSIV